MPKLGMPVLRNSYCCKANRGISHFCRWRCCRNYRRTWNARWFELQKTKQETRLVLCPDEENEDGVMVFPPKSKPDETWDFFENVSKEGDYWSHCESSFKRRTYWCKRCPCFLPVSQLAPQNYPRVDGANAQAIIENWEASLDKSSLFMLITFLRNDKIIVSEREAISEIRNKEIKISKWEMPLMVSSTEWSIWNLSPLEILKDLSIDCEQNSVWWIVSSEKSSLRRSSKARRYPELQAY